MPTGEHWDTLRSYVSADTLNAAADDATLPEDEEEADDGNPQGSEPGDEESGEDGEEGAGGLGRVRQFAGRAVGAVIPQHVVERVAAAPTPGGLFPLIIALLIFLFAIIPANASGHTRLELIWRALTGGASLPNGPKREAQTLTQEEVAVETVATDTWGFFWGDVVSGITGAV